MVIGNPNSFSIIFEVIDEWNNPYTSFNNGILLMTVGGTFFPREVQVSTLSRELWLLSSQLKKIVIQKELFCMSKESAFSIIYDLVHPKDIDDVYNYNYSITPESFSDKHYYVFAVGDGEKVRILACNKLSYNADESRHSFDNLIVWESTVSIQTIESIAENIEKAIESFRKAGDMKW